MRHTPTNTPSKSAPWFKPTRPKPEWTDVSGLITAAGAICTWTDTTAYAYPQRFYRVNGVFQQTVIRLSPGSNQPVQFNLDWDDLACWNTNSHSWFVPLGTYQVYVGASSRDIRLTGSFPVSTPVPSSGSANLALLQPVTVSSVLDTNGPGSGAVRSSAWMLDVRCWIFYVPAFPRFFGMLPFKLVYNMNSGHAGGR